MPKKRSVKGTTGIKMSGRPMHKSRSLKRIIKKTPGGKTVTVYKHKKPAKHKCGICKNVVKGRPRGRPVEIKRKSKTAKKVNRPYGGMLCSKCSRKVISIRAKVKHELIEKKDVPISLRKYIGGGQ